MADDEGRREVVVPLRLYKTVTVFSTLLAVLGVVGGFVLLDRATARASLPAGGIDPWLAAAGLALIAGGGVVYVYGARFQAPGMGTPKDDADESEGDG
ncbi:MAG: hypothetical protein ABEI39_04200 [Halobacteriales archaeon]